MKEELKARREKLKENTDIVFDNMDIIGEESLRVAEVAGNSEQIIEDLDRRFEELTALKGADIAFLFLGVALQVAKTVILNVLTKEAPAGEKNQLEKKLKELQKKIFEGKETDSVANHRYYASTKQIISTAGVPYDATAFEGDNLGLFKGGNHRFSTLGHDPVFGLIFGTANILTNTITTTTKIGGSPVLIVSNHVSYTSSVFPKRGSLNYKYSNPKISAFALNSVVLSKSVERAIDEPEAFVAALIKQIIHIGTDTYTSCGIQIPGASLVLSTEEVEKLTKLIDFGDILKISKSAEYSIVINQLVSVLYSLVNKKEREENKEVFEVKLRKILMYSNVIATASNVIYVAINASLGNEGALKDLDIGGLIVTVGRIISDVEFIQKIKEEFVLGGFRNMIKGEELNLKEVSTFPELEEN